MMESEKPLTLSTDKIETCQHQNIDYIITKWLAETTNTTTSVEIPESKSTEPITNAITTETVSDTHSHDMNDNEGGCRFCHLSKI